METILIVAVFLLIFFGMGAAKIWLKFWVKLWLWLAALTVVVFFFAAVL